MPKFTVFAQHLVSTLHDVEADTLEAAIRIVRRGRTEPRNIGIEVDDSFEINEKVTQEANAGG